MFVIHPVVGGSGKDDRVRLSTVQVDLDTKDRLTMVFLQKHQKEDRLKTISNIK